MFSFKVLLKYSKTVVFPDVCVFCGKGSNSMEEIEGSIGGMIGYWKQLFYGGPMLSIQCHKKCAILYKKLNKKRGLVQIFVLCIMLFFWYLYSGRINRLDILYALLCLIILDRFVLDKFWYKNRFHFVQFDDELVLYFKEKYYFDMVKKLNPEELSGPFLHPKKIAKRHDKAARRGHG